MDDPNNIDPKSVIDPQKLIDDADHIQTIAQDDDILSSEEIDRFMDEKGLGEAWKRDKELIRRGIELADEAAKNPIRSRKDAEAHLRAFTQRYLEMELDGLPEKEKREKLVQLVYGAKTALGEEIDEYAYNAIEVKADEDLMQLAMETSLQVIDERVIPSLENDFTSYLQAETTPFPVSNTEALAAAQYLQLHPQELPPVVIGMVSRIGTLNKSAADLDALSTPLLDAAFVSALTGGVLIFHAAIPELAAALPFLPGVGPLLITTAAVVGALALGREIARRSAKYKRQKAKQEEQRLTDLLASPRISVTRNQDASRVTHVYEEKP